MGGRWSGERGWGEWGGKWRGVGGQSSQGLANPDPANPNCVAQQRGGFWEPWLLGKALLQLRLQFPAATGLEPGPPVATQQRLQFPAITGLQPAPDREGP